MRNQFIHCRRVFYDFHNTIEFVQIVMPGADELNALAKHIVADPDWRFRAGLTDEGDFSFTFDGINQ